MVDSILDIDRSPGLDLTGASILVHRAFLTEYHANASAAFVQNKCEDFPEKYLGGWDTTDNEDSPHLGSGLVSKFG